ncbi:protein-disulfide reductase DsbD family protein [Tuwongella immobilis]|uniref:Protein-disulfide reductase n=1 Tax=Tuwongella immobilis TaxID=692036 RepID=A0A6C2YHL5_9BACT|nr:protein-disulfide reductase DsbD family protein [Tuwongella immobilis]VIP00854.1 Protein-disulfide reductase OS=Isosphaera pallida (strain ATCC 43644 / DSM 9630 / IS1B) GN=Isop_0047 PE=4 SV=1 [Tuwongella immobilis]VTR97126.1 Protein-disulfide reductase OS=Isosphaera pallida (strain ATCC 43644 / DSM 9630 / IS1B) GN=Isop_0047 PE=4 SV=1 [Tuwongella immobilis]
MIIRTLVGALALVLLTSSIATAQDTASDAIESVSASVEPAQARPGELVTVKFTIKLKNGWHTYPTMQVDENARTMVNKLTFPKTGSLVFVGAIKDPANAEVKAEPILEIEKLLIYHGTVTWERKAIVAPNAAAGAAEAKIAARLTVCTDDKCVPVPVAAPAKLTIAGTPVEVAPEYRAEVEKALAAPSR